MASHRTPAVSSVNEDDDIDDPYVVRNIREYYNEPGRGARSSEGRDAQSATGVNSTDAAERRFHQAGPEQDRSASSSRRAADTGRRRSRAGQEARAERTTASASSAAHSEAIGESEVPLFGIGSSGNRHTGAGHQESGAQGSHVDADQEDVEDAEEDRDSYYGILNVPNDATEEQIRDAYRSLAVVLHPDKHTSPALKESAESRFRAVQHAYEVLIDAEKRSIYDHFGARGLSQNWSLVQRSGAGGPRTAAELRDEWERVARKKKADEMDNMVRSKGEYTASIDASALFCTADRVPRSKEVLRAVGREIARREQESGVPFKSGDTVELPPVKASERWNRIGLTTLVGRHGWETPLTSYSRLLFNGQMVSRGGVGGGSLSGTLRTQWNSRFMSEVTTTLTHPRVAAFKGQYEFSQYSFITLVATGRTPSIPPQLQLTYVQRLSAKSSLTGFTAFKTGSYTLGWWGKDQAIRQEQPSIAVGVSSQTGDGKGWSASTSLALENQAVSVDYGFRPVILGSPKVRVGLSLGTASGLAAFNMVDRKITDNVRIGVGVSFGIPSGGVTLKLRFSRLGQRLNIPISMSPEFRSDLVSACTFMPALGILAAEHLYFRPTRRRKIQNRLEGLRTQHADLIAQRKQGAVEAVAVLRAGARKKAHSEWRHDGLIVVEAYYGKRDGLPESCDVDASPDDLFAAAWGHEAAVVVAESEAAAPGAANTPPPPLPPPQQDWWDVTVPVMMLVHKSQLIVAGGRAKHKLLGFFDPCMGERKHLVVRYLFRGRLHEAVVDDVTQLTAPLRAHQL